MQNAKRRVKPPVVVRHLVAEKAARDGMFRVSLEASDAAVLDRDQDAARIRAVQWTHGFEDLAAVPTHEFFPLAP